MSDEHLTNRQKRLNPKSGKFWCRGYDCQLIEEWKKCKNCGKRNGKRRDKK